MFASLHTWQGPHRRHHHAVAALVQCANRGNLLHANHTQLAIYRIPTLLVPSLLDSFVHMYAHAQHAMLTVYSLTGCPAWHTMTQERSRRDDVARQACLCKLVVSA